MERGMEERERREGKGELTVVFQFATNNRPPHSACVGICHTYSQSIPTSRAKSSSRLVFYTLGGLCLPGTDNDHTGSGSTLRRCCRSLSSNHNRCRHLHLDICRDNGRASMHSPDVRTPCTLALFPVSRIRRGLNHRTVSPIAAAFSFSPPLHHPPPPFARAARGPPPSRWRH